MIYLYFSRHKSNQNEFRTRTYSNKKKTFIKCTSQRTLQAQWYRFQVDIASTSESNINAKEQGIYYCIFLAKYPDDKGKDMNSVDIGQNGTHTQT